MPMKTEQKTWLGNSKAITRDEEQRAQEEAEREAQEAIRYRTEEDTTCMETNKDKFKTTIPQDTMIPTAETPNPSDYACQKLHKGDWVKLWYFTWEGCLKAAKPSTSVANNTFSITMEDSSMIQLQSIALSKASRNALSNRSLSWDQIYFTGKVLVRVMKEEEWPLTHANSMVDFFCWLDYEHSNLGHDTDNALIEYQATACKQ